MFKEGDIVFVSNPDREYEERMGIRNHRAFFGRVLTVDTYGTETVIERLVQLNVTDDAKDAEEMYLAAEKAAGSEETTEKLHVSPYGASIRYGGGYEDRYQIVEY